MKAILAKVWGRLGPTGAGAVIALLLSLVILLQNVEPVSIDILFWDAVLLSKPYFIGLCVAIGFVMGLWAGWRLKGRAGAG